MNIQDKVIVITGGASGLGLVAARFLSIEKGARIAVFDRDSAAGAQAVEYLGASRTMVAQVDVSSEDQVQRAVDSVIERMGCNSCLHQRRGPADGVKGAGQEWKSHRVGQIRTDHCRQQP